LDAGRSGTDVFIGLPFLAISTTRWIYLIQDISQNSQHLNGFIECSGQREFSYTTCSVVNQVHYFIKSFLLSFIHLSERRSALKTQKLLFLMVAVGIILAPVLGFSTVLKIGLQAEPSSMDPHYHNLTPNNMMAKYTFDPLIIQDHKQNLKPGLAVSWKPISDLTWEFKLRRDVKFHDDSPFTAEDVKFTLERAPNVPNSPSSFGRFINHVKKIEIVDPHTIRLTTADPFPLMATYMSGLVIISKKHGEGAATKDFNSG
jgi:ABC-type transport system substrate-binding protein